MSRGVRVSCGFCGLELRRGQDCPTCAPVVELAPVTRFDLAVNAARALSHVAPVIAGESPEARLARCLRAAVGQRGRYSGRAS